MRIIFLAIITLNTLLANSQSKSRIDKVKTVREIDTLIAPIIEYSEDFYVNKELDFYTPTTNEASNERYIRENNSCKKICDSLKIKPWIKVDIDNNQLTDLIVLGEYFSNPQIACVLDLGDNNYVAKLLSRDIYSYCIFATVLERKADQPLILFHHYQSGIIRDTTKKINLTDTLIFKYGDFVEYNPKPDDYKISNIEFHYSIGALNFSDRSYKMTIDNKRNIIKSTYKFDTRDIEHVQKGQLSTEDYQALLSLINYLGIKNLNADYKRKWTDGGSSRFRFTLNGGEIISIADKSQIGTFGLNRLTHYLDDLTKAVEWTKQ